jgi:cytochrome P450
MDYGEDLIEEARKRKKDQTEAFDENGNAIEKKDEKVNFIIDQLVNHEEKFTNQEIREHLLTLLITASETTANYVATTLILLAMNQDIQQKVYEEICEVFNTENVEVHYDSIGKLKYLEMVMKEALRLFSPIPISVRETTDKFDVGLDKPMEKGGTIFIFHYILHRRKDIWGQDADKFDPERFSPENVSKRDPYSFLPFGAGPRSCIGIKYAMISSKIELMRFLQAYKFSTNFKEKDLKMKLAFTGKLSVKHLVSIEKRT